jgi:hypothetical protein
MVMIKVNYDSNGNILGYYPDAIGYSIIPEPYIEIDEATHQDCINNQGFRKIDEATKTIIKYTSPVPTAEEIKKQRITQLDAEYNPQFDALTLAWATAYMLGDTVTADARKTDKTALTNEYNTKKGVIENG